MNLGVRREMLKCSQFMRPGYCGHRLFLCDRQFSGLKGCWAVGGKCSQEGPAGMATGVLCVNVLWVNALWARAHQELL